MLRAKRTTTTDPSCTGRCSCLNISRSVRSKVWGVEMFTIRPRKSDRAVEAAPIIWFMTSHTALRVSSLSSRSSMGVSTPIRMSTITFTSLSFSSMMLLPSRPDTYLISTPMAGSMLPREKSSAETTETVGVVMSTRWSSKLDTAVAEEPRLMFMISPMASISMELKISLLIAARSPFPRRFHRHC